jgi:predicted RNA-binding Zn-ribbon protein involved in translation (DUF1610 family)
MPKCPSCGTGIAINRLLRGGKDIPCPRCAAVLRYPGWVKACSYIGGVLGVVGGSILIYPVLFSVYHRLYGLSVLFGAIGIGGYFTLVFAVPAFSVLHWGPLLVVEMRPVCDHCGMVIPLSNPQFCPKCGDRLTVVNKRGKQGSVVPK